MTCLVSKRSLRRFLIIYPLQLKKYLYRLRYQQISHVRSSLYMLSRISQAIPSVTSSAVHNTESVNAQIQR